MTTDFRQVHVEFPTRIAGIPCLIEATITPGSPGNLYEPPCPTEASLTVLDRRRRRARWLERKLTREEITRLENEALEEEAALWDDY